MRPELPRSPQSACVVAPNGTKLRQPDENDPRSALFSRLECGVARQCGSRFRPASSGDSARGGQPGAILGLAPAPSASAPIAVEERRGRGACREFVGAEAGPEAVLAEPQPPTELRSKAGANAGVLLDFGVEIQGYLELFTLMMPEQTVAECACALGNRRPKPCRRSAALKTRATTMPCAIRW